MRIVGHQIIAVAVPAVITTLAFQSEPLVQMIWVPIAILGAIVFLALSLYIDTNWTIPAIAHEQKKRDAIVLDDLRIRLRNEPVVFDPPMENLWYWVCFNALMCFAFLFVSKIAPACYLIVLITAVYTVIYTLLAILGWMRPKLRFSLEGVESAWYGRFTWDEIHSIHVKQCRARGLYGGTTSSIVRAQLRMELRLWKAGQWRRLMRVFLFRCIFWSFGSSKELIFHISARGFLSPEGIRQVAELYREAGRRNQPRRSAH